MKTRNPNAKQALKTTKHLHRQVTRNNMPGIMSVPNITQDMNTVAHSHAQRINTNAPKATKCAVTRKTHHHIVMQHAINVLTLQEQATYSTVLRASPLVHPLMRQTISSYKKLMNNPATAEV
jgi:hypothetical protein